MQFFLNALFLTLSQMLSLFGIIFGLGFSIYFLEKQISSLLGWKKLMWTAWLGTPLHEIGHVFFCIVFRHKLLEIKLFKPDPKTGVLGYVNHAYNKDSFYQNLGNLFIGAGPLILGSIVIYNLTILAIPNASSLITDYTMLAQKRIEFDSGLFTYLISLAEISTKTLSVICTIENISSFKFWTYFYVVFCISTHMAPSPTDFKGGITNGITTFFLLLLFVNIINEPIVDLFGINVFNDFFIKLMGYQAILSGLLIFSLLIVLLNYLLTVIFNRVTLHISKGKSRT
ncbi:MAG: hypothetical protein AB1394_08025 [Bacteroidota bacterium]